MPQLFTIQNITALEEPVIYAVETGQNHEMIKLDNSDLIK